MVKPDNCDAGPRRSRWKHRASSLQIVHCFDASLVLFWLSHISWCINVLLALAGLNVPDLDTTKTVLVTAQDLFNTERFLSLWFCYLHHISAQVPPILMPYETGHQADLLSPSGLVTNGGWSGGDFFVYLISEKFPISLSLVREPASARHNGTPHSALDSL